MDHEEVIQQLRTSIRSGNLAALQAALNSNLLSAADLSKELPDALRDLTTMRCLLEHGADPDTVEIKEIFYGSAPDGCLDTLRVLDDFGYSRIESEGHLVLQ